MEKELLETRLAEFESEKIPMVLTIGAEKFYFTAQNTSSDIKKILEGRKEESNDTVELNYDFELNNLRKKYAADKSLDPFVLECVREYRDLSVKNRPLQTYVAEKIANMQEVA